jgi:copper homeostasis protein
MSEDTSRVLVEVCVGSVADIEAAIAAGADRVELCGGLELGGLTPSIGLVETALADCSIPVVVMLRPRAGGFCYDRHEFQVMLRDAERFLGLGARGIVFGLLDEQGCIDVPRCRALVQCAGTNQSVFHRAFDFTSDRRTAIDALIDIGCTRVLTSGGKLTASDGAAALREMIAHVAGRIEIMPGGGIDADNVAQIVRATRCSQVHIGAAGPSGQASPPGAADIDLRDSRFLHGPVHRVVVGTAVSDAIYALKAAALRP